ncbi:MAG: DUF4935 domain-containing protein [Chlorobiaceae bacterium]|nr:DUF4935 domain-containing protein [Chlorobiaceae bacterium]
MSQKTVVRSRPVYVFVDTNIFLDYYRGTSDASLSLLKKMDLVKDRIISTYQVEMEFKKNRQDVIKQTINGLKMDAKWALPVLFRDSNAGNSLHATKKDAELRLKKMRQKVAGLLTSPGNSDEVYKAFENIFHNPSTHVLTRDMIVRHQIKRLAFRRFILGYPPRKSGDTSIGDALNWEWIVYCGQNLSGKIIIVSRDSDYGVSVDGKTYLNDHLVQEYKERVGPKRVIELTDKLSVALKELKIAVTKEEIKAEAEQVSQQCLMDDEDLNVLVKALKNLGDQSLGEEE